MKKFSIKVVVSLKEEVKDTQGLALDKMLKHLNIEECANFRQGKFFSFNISAPNYKEAREKLDFICCEVISNPVIEKYDILSFEEII